MNVYICGLLVAVVVIAEIKSFSSRKVRTKRISEIRGSVSHFSRLNRRRDAA